MLGSLLSLAAAAMFGLNSATIRRGVLTGTVIQGVAISVPVGIPIFLIAGMITGAIALVPDLDGTDMAVLALAGAIHFAFGRYCNYRALQAIGANLTRPLQQLSLILTLILALIFLDESLTPLRLLGIVLLMGGPMFMIKDRKRRAAPDGDTDLFRPDYRVGVMFALLSAVGFGISPVLISFTLDGMGVWSGISGGLIAYIGGGAVILGAVAVTGRTRHVVSADKTSMKWFLLSGVFVSLSQMLRFMALAVAPVSIVAPIQQTTNVFQMLFAWLINRQHEAFGPWVAAGIVISMIGAIFVSLSLDPVLTSLDLPEGLVRFLGWRWP